MGDASSTSKSNPDPEHVLEHGEDVAAAAPRFKILPGSPISKARCHHLLIMSLAFTHGAANVICLIQFGIYASFVTGNTLSAARAFGASQAADGAYYSSVVGAYFVGVVAAQPAIVQKSRMSALAPIPIALGALTSLARWASGGSRYSILVLMPMLGFVNTVTQSVDGVTTHLYTGHWTKVGQNLYVLVTKGWRPGAHSAQLSVSLSVIAAFFVGAVSSQAFFLAVFDGAVPLGTSAVIGLIYALLLVLRDPLIRTPDSSTTSTNRS